MPLFDGEKRLLFRVHKDADDYFIEKLTAAFDDIQVTVGDGVERTWVNGTSHGIEW
jgi:hypothetical protein